MGNIVLKTENYLLEANRQLTDVTTYQLITNYSKQQLFNNIADQLNALYALPVITEAEALYTVNSRKSIIDYFLRDQNSWRVCVIYFNPKVHKAKVMINNRLIYSCRPICSSIGNPLYKTAKYLCSIFQLMENITPLLIHSSKELLNLIEAVKLPTSTQLLTADVKSLYPSIAHTIGINAIEQCIKAYNASNPPVPIDLPFIITILKICLYNNYIEFNGQVYKQVQGTAMGSPFAPPYANIFMSYIESQVLTDMVRQCNLANLDTKLYLPMIYTRLLDDIFAAFPSIDGLKMFQDTWTAISPNDIILEYNTGDIVNYLDITIAKGDRFRSDGYLDICLYQKPNNLFLYTPYNSNIGKHIPNNWIYQEIIRPKLYCTNEIEFDNAKTALYNRLINRDYPANILQPLFDRNTPSRVDLLSKLIRKTRPIIQYPSLKFINQMYMDYSTNTINRANIAMYNTVYQREIIMPIPSNIPLIFKIPYTTRTKKLNIRSLITSNDPDLNTSVNELNHNNKSPTICYTKWSSLSSIVTPSKMRRNELEPNVINNMLGIT